MDKATCLVTGCAGFVGSHLARALLDAGHPVAGVDNFFSGRRENMAGFADHPDFTFYERCVTQDGLMDDLKAAHPDLDAVFHLAAVVSVPYSVEHPEQTMAVNYEATARLHARSRELGLSRFVFAGSAAEYGEETRLPVKEEYATADTRRASPYGEAKYLSSALIRDSGFGTSLRFFNIYGPRQDPKSPYSGVISAFMYMAARRKPLTVHGDGGQTRDFVYVSDTIEAYLLAAGLDSAPLAGVYNVASGTRLSIMELAEIVNRVAGSDAGVAAGPARLGDVRHSRADIGRLAAKGYKPAVPLDEGLAKTYAWTLDNEV